METFNLNRSTQIRSMVSVDRTVSVFKWICIWFLYLFPFFSFLIVFCPLAFHVFIRWLYVCVCVGYSSVSFDRSWLILALNITWSFDLIWMWIRFQFFFQIRFILYYITQHKRICTTIRIDNGFYWNADHIYERMNEQTTIITTTTTTNHHQLKHHQTTIELWLFLFVYMYRLTKAPIQPWTTFMAILKAIHHQKALTFQLKMFAIYPNTIRNCAIKDRTASIKCPPSIVGFNQFWKQTKNKQTNQIGLNRLNIKNNVNFKASFTQDII